MMVMNDKNPRPRNSAEPQGRGCGALIEGHMAKRPVSGRERHAPLPPIQLSAPLSPTSLAPMSRTTVPVTTGGKMRLRIRGGTKDMAMGLRDRVRESARGAICRRGGGDAQERAQAGRAEEHAVCLRACTTDGDTVDD